MEIFKICVFVYVIFKSKNENATRKQSFFENVKMPFRVCLEITQSYAYAVKLPSEVKIFSHLKKSVSLA